MAKAEVIKKLVKAHVSGDETRFREAIESLIHDEQKLGHNLLAEDLRTLLQKSIQRRTGTTQSAPAAPTPTHLTFLPGQNRSPVPPAPPLVDVIEPQTRLSDLVLAPETERRLGRVIEEHQRSSELAAYRLKPKQRLLFVGPPGCGKTYAAGMLAAELNLPLVHVRVDAVVSSYLGETSANLRRVFEYSTERPCVLFFDEFDSVGADRGNPHEVGELRRVVNSFLQLIDSWVGPGLIVAATNYEVLLDDALWRRFEDVVNFDIPTPGRVSAYLRLLVRGVIKGDDFELSNIATRMAGLSFSQIRDVVTEAIKTMVLAGQTKLSCGHITEQLELSTWRMSQKLIKRRVKLEKDS